MKEGICLVSDIYINVLNMDNRGMNVGRKKEIVSENKINIPEGHDEVHFIVGV